MKVGDQIQLTDDESRLALDYIESAAGARGVIIGLHDGLLYPKNQGGNYPQSRAGEPLRMVWVAVRYPYDDQLIGTYVHWVRAESVLPYVSRHCWGGCSVGDRRHISRDFVPRFGDDWGVPSYTAIIFQCSRCETAILHKVVEPS
jgi:hypothetical protein